MTEAGAPEYFVYFPFRKLSVVKNDWMIEVRLEILINASFL
jgi:hypothetical protein